jgi:hypothetical protein
MRIIGTIYIDGAFVMPHGDDRAPLFNPETEKQIGEVRLGDGDDLDFAVAAAKRAFPAMARTTPAERAVRRCHVIEMTTRSGIAVRNFKRPRRPRATWSSPRREARGAIELI